MSSALIKNINYLLKEKKRRKSKNLEEGQEVPVGC